MLPILRRAAGDSYNIAVTNHGLALTCRMLGVMESSCGERLLAGCPAAGFRTGLLATAGALGWRGGCGYGQRMRAVLIDIDGVLTVSWEPLPGAVAALHQLRAAGVPLALVTNTTSRTRASIASVLAGAGFPVTAGDVLTAPVIAAAYLHDRYPGARYLLLSSGDIAEDLAGLTLGRESDPEPARAVLVGGAGPEFSYQALNQAFGLL
jgi:hypothetical protein